MNKNFELDQKRASYIVLIRNHVEQAGVSCIVFVYLMVCVIIATIGKKESKLIGKTIKFHLKFTRLCFLQELCALYVALFRNYLLWITKGELKGIGVCSWILNNALLFFCS